MDKKELTAALEKLYAEQKKMSAYVHAIGLIDYDGKTGAPKETAENRASAISVLSGEIYRMSVDKENRETLETLDKNKDMLDEKEKRIVYLLLKGLRETEKIPQDEYIAYSELTVKADDVWHKAKEISDFGLFMPYLEKIFEYQKRFAGYIAPEKAPYDRCLDGYEEGLDRSVLDVFFAKLRDGIVPLVKAIAKKPQIDDSIRFGNFPADKQKELSLYVMKIMELDLGHVGLAETEHPFTTTFGSHLDTRITTHYHTDDFTSSLFSVIHEGGHALYETGVDDSFAYTSLDGGAAMSIHESQSRFYENIIGRSREFCSFLFPKICELFPEQMKGRTENEFFRAVNKVTPSLIRTEADELTYCLHIMVRYELEKRIFAGDLKVSELPKAWNALYEEYLGITPPNDRLGVLQDSHWSMGLIGYFPSYALGSAYGAQFFSLMKKEIDVKGSIAKGDFSKLNEWNRNNIWRFGTLYSPDKLISRVVSGKFDPRYYVDYLTEKYTDLYKL